MISAAVLEPVHADVVEPNTSTVVAANFGDEDTNSSPAIVLPNQSNAATYPPMYLTGSQLVPEKKPLHPGIYIIAAWNMIGFVLSFFGSSQTNVIYGVITFLDLLVGVGLLCRLEVARKIMLWLSAIMIILSVISLIILAGLQQRIAQSKAHYETAVSKINQQTLTSTERQELADIQTKLDTQEKQAGKAIGLTYFEEGAFVVEGLAVIVYLTRPKIKAVFAELPA